MKSWPGHTHTTNVMDIDGSLEWDLFVSERKTEIRSPKPLLDPDISSPSMVMLHHGGRYMPFVLIDVWREELNDVTDDDAMAEGFDSLASFKRHWVSKTGVAHFSLVERVWGYELKQWDPREFVLDRMKPGVEGSEDVVAVMSLVEHLYPMSMT